MWDIKDVNISHTRWQNATSGAGDFSSLNQISLNPAAMGIPPLM